jgi:hypothetical protein
MPPMLGIKISVISRSGAIRVPPQAGLSVLCSTNFVAVPLRDVRSTRTIYNSSLTTKAFFFLCTTGRSMARRTTA